MSLPVTLSLLAATLGLTVLCGWRGARPPDPRKGPRLIPWRLLMIFAAAGIFLMVVHLLALIKEA